MTGMRPPLSGRRVLIVEDRYLIAAELADQVRRLGAEVLGPARSVAAAEAILAHESIDVALLDVNLEDELAFPLAVGLAAKGLPFIFMTGYDREILPPEWRDRPTLTKPVMTRALGDELSSLCPRRG